MVSGLKNKAFTLTEVITILIILGVILVVAIPSVGKLQEKFKEEYYKQLDSSVIAATKMYFKSNAEARPSGELAILKLSHDRLIESKYIDSINLYNSDTKCSGFVAVLKKGKEYIYENCMKCGDDVAYSNELYDLDDLEGEERSKKATSNICKLADLSSIEDRVDVVYNTKDITPLYLYAGNYSTTDLKSALEINEVVSLVVDRDSSDPKVAYDIVTGNKIYPTNITAIDLTKETVNASNVNVGIKVAYENSESRQIYVYNYEAPLVANSIENIPIKNGLIRSSINDIKLSLENVKFETPSGVAIYPYTEVVGTDKASMLTPLYYNNKTSSDNFSVYQYNIAGTDEWKDLTCSSKSDCQVNSKSIEETNSKIRFRMKAQTAGGSTIYGAATEWFDIKNFVVVTFDSTNATVDEAYRMVEYGKTYSETISGTKEFPIPKREGYTFTNWYDAKTGGKEVKSTDKMNNANDHTLYAGWKVNQYTLTFDPNGGTIATKDKTKTIDYNSKYGTLPSATKTGYTLDGWYTSKTGGNAVTKDTVMGAKNVTVYAHWKPISSVVTLKENGASTSIASMKVEYDSTYGSLTAPTKTGYTFIGWFDESYKDNPLNFYADKYADLKAAFGYNQESLWNHYLTYGNNEGRQISQYIASTKVTAITDHTLYACYIANSYTVTLNANGGTVSPSAITVKYNSQYSLPEAKRSGYIFKGWFTATSGGTEKTSTTTMTTAENHTLYAQWEEIVTVTVTTVDCEKKNLAAGVYYIEIVGGGAGGHGKAGDYGGNAARWAGYVYLPAVTNAPVCVGEGTAGTHGFIGSTPRNGGSSYIANSSGNYLIEAMGGINYKGTYSSAITNFANGAVAKLVCNDVAGKTRNGNTVTYGYGGAKSGIGTFTNATDGKKGIIKYQYIKSLSSWDAAPLACPTTPLCTVSDCGWVNWPA